MISAITESPEVAAVKARFPTLSALPATTIARMVAMCAEEAAALDDVMGDRRFRHVATARHRVMLLLRDELGLTFPAIGHILGVHHSTVMNGVRRASVRAGLIEPGRAA